MIRIKRIAISEEKTQVIYDLGEDTFSLKSSMLDLDSIFKEFKRKYLNENFYMWHVKEFSIFYDKKLDEPIRCIIGVSMNRGDNKTIFRQEISALDKPNLNNLLDKLDRAIKVALKTHFNQLKI